MNKIPGRKAVVTKRKRPVDLADKDVSMAEWIKARVTSVSGECAANEYVEDAQYGADLELAYRWVDGRSIIRDKRGLPTQQYIKDDQFDYEGRFAFARVMRSDKPVPYLLRHRLATYAESSKRRIVFREPKKRGAKRQDLKPLVLALQIWMEVRKDRKLGGAGKLGDARDGAYSRVIKKFKVSLRTLQNAWGRYESLFEPTN
jgi:hypothetical protein